MYDFHNKINWRDVVRLGWALCTQNAKEDKWLASFSSSVLKRMSYLSLLILSSTTALYTSLLTLRCSTILHLLLPVRNCLQTIRSCGNIPMELKRETERELILRCRVQVLLLVLNLWSCVFWYLCNITFHTSGFKLIISVRLIYFNICRKFCIIWSFELQQSCFGCKTKV